MSMDSVKGLWEDPQVAKRYKAAEAWTSPPGRRLIEQSGLLVDKKDSIAILDNACGTGVITTALHDMMTKDAVENMKLTCSDLSPVMLEATKQKIEMQGWKAETKVADAEKTGFPDEAFDYVFTSFGLLVLPDGQPSLKECYRILKPNGINALSTWETVAWIPDVEAALRLISGAPQMPPGQDLFSMSGAAPWNDRSWLEESLRKAGFTDIKVEVVQNPCVAESSEEQVENLLPLLMGILLKKLWNEEEMKKYGPEVKPKLLEYIEGKYGKGKQFTVDMVALVATGRKVG